MKEYKRTDAFHGEYSGCCFFEEFPATQDPDFDWGDENAKVVFFCHMLADKSDSATDICRGDYCKCPIAYGKAEIQLAVK